MIGVMMNLTKTISPFKIIEINEFGKAVWLKDGTNIMAHREYRWCDSVLVVDEGRSRLVLETSKFSTFDFTGWTPLTKNEYVKYLDGTWK
jgi:hypothetical protein